MIAIDKREKPLSTANLDRPLVTYKKNVYTYICIIKISSLSQNFHFTFYKEIST